MCRLGVCRSGELTVLTTSYNGPSLSGNIVATLSSAVSFTTRIQMHSLEWQPLGLTADCVMLHALLHRSLLANIDIDLACISQGSVAPGMCR